MAEPLTDAEFAALQKLGVFVTVERAVEYIQAALAAVPRLASPVAQEAAGEREDADVVDAPIAEGERFPVSLKPAERFPIPGVDFDVSAAPPRGGASAGGGDDEPELCPCGKGTSCLGCDAAASAGEGQG